MRCRVWGTVLMRLSVDASVSAWLTRSKSCFISEITQSRCHSVTITFITPSRLAKLNGYVHAHYSATPVASLAGSHNKRDARDTGIDAQQLVEFVVDGAPIVVQLLQVSLPHLYFLSSLILTYI